MENTAQVLEENVTQGAGQGHDYRVTSVEQIIPPPPGTGEEKWFSYILQSADSVIKGQRSGTREKVMQHAEGFAEELNARNRLGYRRKWSPVNKRPQK